MHFWNLKPKFNHVVIVTSDEAFAKVKKIKIKPEYLTGLIIALCLAIGMILGIFAYKNLLINSSLEKNKELEAQIEELTQKNSELQATIDDLQDKNEILSNTVNQKVETENELNAVIEGQSTPTGFPLNGSASLEESDGDIPTCIFTASAGDSVIATAQGTVIDVSDDATYGHIVKIDHGNGYISIYLNKGEPTVKQGDNVVAGSTLFIITKDNTTLGYEMMLDGQYINPMEMLAIEG